MPNPNLVAHLRNVLAELYPDRASMQRVIADAGLSAARVALNSSAINNWQAILSEAERANRVDALLDVVLGEYGDNAKLRTASAAYRAAVEQDSDSAKIPSSSTASEVNTGGGAYVAGDVETGEGDFIGRDKTVDGDEVKRDKAGRDIYNFSGPVVFNQNPEGKAPPASDISKGTSPNPTIPHINADKQIDIFLSYSRIDSEIMRRLRDDLRVAGFTVWTDDVGLEPGTPSWQRAIEEAIQAARCTVVLLSPEAKQSRWVEIEVSFAEELGLRVFPLLVRGDDRNAILLRLRTTQRIDLRSDYQQAVTAQLVPALRRYLQSTKTPEPIAIERNQAPNLVKPVPPKTAPWWIGGFVFGVLLLVLLLINGSRLRDLFIVGSGAPPTLTVLATGSTPTQLALVAKTPTATQKPLPTNTPVPAPATALPTAPPSDTAMPATDTPAPTVAFTPAPTATLAPEAGATRTNPKDGAVYVWIPAGAFMMGASITDTLAGTAGTDEQPQHRVVLDGFWIMQTEVTNTQYKRCVEAKVCTTPNNTRWNDQTYAAHPVVNVTWDQAQTYADWVGGRLPTEAEWEKACRGTDGRLYPWGNQTPNPQLLNYSGSNKGDTMPVASYPPGANGLFDMAGNVWEWTADWYDENYYANSPEHNPKGPDSGPYRTLRGGSFNFSVDDVRCAARFGFDPDLRLNIIGFRVVSPGF